MKFIVGLGNPLPQYQNSRHNFGQAVVSAFQQKQNFSIFKFQKKFNCLISQGEVNNEKVILLLPQTFMNNSGQAIKKIISNFQLPIFNLWVVYDDLDLPLGKIRIKTTGSSAGHKGVESIIQHLGQKNFIRFRLGIGKKSQIPKPKSPKEIEKFVLAKFNQEEKRIVEEVIKKTLQAIELTLEKGVEKTMSQYN